MEQRCLILMKSTLLIFFICNKFFFLICGGKGKESCLRNLFLPKSHENILLYYLLGFIVLTLTFKKFLFIYLFVYLFLAVLGLRCCARAFSSCGKQGLLFVALHGLLIAVASLVAEHGLQARGLQ